MAAKAFRRCRPPFAKKRETVGHPQFHLSADSKGWATRPNVTASVIIAAWFVPSESGAGKRRFGRLQVEQALQRSGHLLLLHFFWKFLEFTGQGPGDSLRHPGHDCV